MPPRKDLARVEIYSFEYRPRQKSYYNWRASVVSPAVKDIEHAIFAATAG
jgi:hypothetical protein